MPTPITGYGGDYLYGTATDNTETDYFLVFGADNTISTSGGGNLIVTGGNLAPYGQDTATTIDIGDSVGPGTAYTTDLITLDGSHNLIAGNDGTTVPYAILDRATVRITVQGTGDGHNYVGLDNVGGRTDVSLTGGSNTVYLNDDAFNTIVAGTAGHATVVVGYPDDDAGYGYTTSVRLAGANNFVQGGDANFHVFGGTSYNAVDLGEGDNDVQLSGVYNSIRVGGGSNQIYAGAGYNFVYLGANDTQTGEYYPAGNDVVAINGNHNTVVQGSSGYNDANVSVTSNGGYNTVTLASGNDIVKLLGDHNVVTLGNGTDYIWSPGNYNTLVAGSGNDTVDLGGGSVQSVTLGNGNDLVTGTGYLNTITLGNGNDTVSDSGSSVTITAGSGNDTITANGYLARVTLGAGNDVVSATGGFARVTINSSPFSTDSVTVGDYSHVAITSGLDTVTGHDGNLIQLDGSVLGSSVNMVGPGNALFLSGNASANVNLGLSGGNDDITVTANPGGTYAGTVDLLNFGRGDLLTLDGFGYTHLGGGAGGFLPMANATHTGFVVDLSGGGQIDFTGPQAFNPHEFKFA